MKRFILSAFLAFFGVYACMVSGQVANAAENSELRVLTFNIRMSFGEVGKPTEWKLRKEQVADIMKAKNYDFIGVQEAIITQKADLNQVEDLKMLLPEYGLLTRSRMKSEIEGESTPIMWRKDRWEIDAEKQGVFWLSDTPNEPESNSWKGGCPRTVVWGKFHEITDGKRTGRCVYFINTHFDHMSEKARQFSAVQIADFVKKTVEPEATVFVTGDFNTGINSPAVSYLCGKEADIQGEKRTGPIMMLDTFRVANPDMKDAPTYHAYGKYLEGGRIDYVLMLGNLKVKSAEIIRTKTEIYPSDHFPVDAILAW
ncbi:MAG: endonuclease/exonuclease/phosphatase family protein [Planctomycetia bacterium]|nr:endonuclease/exonuclease/phosphatase family protein [Planctomycetia bacterium]